MTDEIEDDELIKSVERWGIRLLSAIKSFCINHDINAKDLKNIGLEFFDIFLSKKVVLVAFRIPEEPSNAYFRIHWKGDISINDLMDLSYNIVREEDGRLSIFRMFDFPESICDSLFVAPTEIQIVGIGLVQRCYSGFLLMQHHVFHQKDPERLAVDFLRNAKIITNIRTTSGHVKLKERSFSVPE